MTLDEQVHRALGKGRTNRYPAYSKSWCHAGKALEEISRLYEIDCYVGGGPSMGSWFCDMSGIHRKGFRVSEWADIAPEAICRAIVAAKEKLDV